MFVVIQEISVKKSDKGGYAKELKSEYCPIILDGKDIGHYWHHYSDERFERPIKKAYRVSIHHSFRKEGKVQKKQFVLCTVNYYDLAEDFFSLYDWCNSKINLISIVTTGDMAAVVIAVLLPVTTMKLTRLC